MATAVPNPLTLTYAETRLAAALQAQEDALAASQVSGSGNTWSPQALAELRLEVAYWARQVQTFKQKALGSRRPSASVAVFTR